MFSAKLDNTNYLIRLERGEEIVSTIKNFCKENNISNGSFSGIGSLENPTLAHYRVDSKKYSEKKFEGIFEVTGLLGNIAGLNDDIVLHPHISLSDEQMQTYGGHLVNAQVSATMEIIITVFPTHYEKKQSKEIGLNLWKLNN
jgi:uncharacterized protein